MPARIWLVGEHNPYSADPRLALFPAPAQSAGARLCAMLGMGRAEYLKEFERRNLMPHEVAGWSAPAARLRADEVLRAHPIGDGLVLLGARVSAAFGADFRSMLFRPRFVQVGAGDVLRGLNVLVLPHPSGRSREWNRPEAAALLRGAMDLLREDVHRDRRSGGVHAG